MNDVNVWMRKAFDTSIADFPICLSDGKIPNTRIVWHVFNKNTSIHLPIREGLVRVLFLAEGEAVFLLGKSQIEFFESAVIVPGPHATIEIDAKLGTKILEIDWILPEDEFFEYSEREADVLLAMRYEDAEKYREVCKSAKTTNRLLVPPRLIPRFSMGSVETSGNDRIDKHAHPMLEQYFFGLGKNNCELLVNHSSISFGENTLVHIPLGSNHGIKSNGQQIVQYLWIDFLLDNSGLEYLDKAHEIFP